MHTRRDVLGFALAGGACASLPAPAFAIVDPLFGLKALIVVLNLADAIKNLGKSTPDHTVEFAKLNAKLDLVLANLGQLDLKVDDVYRAVLGLYEKIDQVPDRIVDLQLRGAGVTAIKNYRFFKADPAANKSRLDAHILNIEQQRNSVANRDPGLHFASMGVARLGEVAMLSLLQKTSDSTSARERLRATMKEYTKYFNESVDYLQKKQDTFTKQWKDVAQRVINLQPGFQPSRGSPPPGLYVERGIVNRGNCVAVQRWNLNLETGAYSAGGLSWTRYRARGPSQTPTCQEPANDGNELPNNYPLTTTNEISALAATYKVAKENEAIAMQAKDGCEVLAGGLKATGRTR